MSYTIDPVGRMEGHMGLEFDVNDPGFETSLTDPVSGTAKDAKAMGTMFRGFENIMLDRQPQEGIQICQRI